jgi:mono/diheme cytochrome c family protein
LSHKYQGNQYPVSNLVDGNKDNFMHTKERQKNPWVKAEFASATTFNEIMIWNRPGFESRFNNARIEFFNGRKNLGSVQVGSMGGGGSSPIKDPWLQKPYSTAKAHLENRSIVNEEFKVDPPKHLSSAAKQMYIRGAAIYRQDAFCSTCHQPDGLGLESSHFPPLSKTKWATQDTDRLIKLTLHGLQGEIEVKGKKYPGLVPMTAFGKLLDDTDVASVLTYVRNSFGNKASIVKPEDVKRIRAETGDRELFYLPEELLKQHPHK